MSQKHVLAFGDSLTAGYYAKGLKFHPYTNKLQELIGDKKSYHVTTKGFSGYTTHDLLVELSKILKTPARKGLKTVVSYDIVCILAGTNDLGRYSDETTLHNLIEMHRLVHSTNGRTVAITMPEHGQECEYKELKSKRKAINAQLQVLANDSRGAMTVLDLSTHLPRSSLSPADLKVFWDDELHYTPAGYDRFGELLHAHLVSNKLIASNARLIDERKRAPKKRQIKKNKSKTIVSSSTA